MKIRGILTFVGIWVVLIVVAIGSSQISYRQTAKIQSEQLVALVGRVVRNFPEQELDVMQVLKQYEKEDVAEGWRILAHYGYTQDKQRFGSIQEGLGQVMLMNCLLVSGIMLGVGGFVGWQMRKRKQELHDLSGYLRQISSGDYSLQIGKVSEGERSLLEDEIYKTTLYLRESKELQEKEKLALAQSLTDISHQLKTPLTSMGIMTELLIENEADEVNKGFIQQIERQVERLSHLVGILLRLAKLDSGTVVFKQEEIVVEHIIGEVVEALEPMVRQKEIQVVLQGTEQAALRGDPGWIYEALYNVVHNGIRYTPVGGRLTIGWKMNPIYTVITVADTGGGIHKEDLPHLFTRFYKGKNASKESVGIGLAMARSIIQRHSGEMRVANTKEGACFTIKFYHVT